jgi:hypothetical protein
VINKGHLQVKTVGIAHYLRITVLFLSLVDEDKHAEHLKLAIGFAGKGVLPEWGQ